jgi:hypothetical protein
MLCVSQYSRECGSILKRTTWCTRGAGDPAGRRMISNRILFVCDINNNNNNNLDGLISRQTGAASASLHQIMWKGIKKWLKAKWVKRQKYDWSRMRIRHVFT